MIGIAHNGSGTARILIFTGPGLLRIARVLGFYKFGIAHNGSGIARVPISTAPGLLGIAPGLHVSLLFTGSGLLIPRT